MHLGSDRALAGEAHLGTAGHAELPSPVRTGSGSEGVISARLTRRAPLSMRNTRRLDVSTSSLLYLARARGSVAFRRFVMLLPLRLVCERIEPTRLVDGEDAVQMVELVL